MLAFNFNTSENSEIVVWQIEDEEEVFFLQKLKLNQEEKEELNRINFPKRRMQWLASRYCIRYIINQDEFILLKKDIFGKPNLPELSVHISVSHSEHYAAAMLNTHKAVGIDVEKIQPKIERLAYKFSKPEIEQSLMKVGEEQLYLTLIWSAKESIYKMYGLGGLDFKEDMLVRSFHLKTEGSFEVWFTKTNSQLQLHYRFFKNHVLSWVEA